MFIQSKLHYFNVKIFSGMNGMNLLLIDFKCIFINVHYKKRIILNERKQYYIIL